MKITRALENNILSCINDSGTEKSTISGTVSLPQGETAPAGGISVGVHVFVNSLDPYAKHLQVKIPEGSNSTTYSTDVERTPYFGVAYTVVGGEEMGYAGTSRRHKLLYGGINFFNGSIKEGYTGDNSRRKPVG